jgi:hypothetical protein
MLLIHFLFSVKFAIQEIIYIFELFFHSIRFKVNKVGVRRYTIFLVRARRFDSTGFFHAMKYNVLLYLSIRIRNIFIIVYCSSSPLIFIPANVGNRAD